MFSIFLVQIDAAHLHVLEKKNYNISVDYCVANEHTAQSGGKVTVLTLVASPATKCCGLMVEVQYEVCKKKGLILRTLEQRQRSRQAAQDRE